MLFICLIITYFLLLCIITVLFITRDREIVTHIYIEELSFSLLDPAKQLVYDTQTESDSEGYPSTDSLSN